ncbi:NADPH-dependent FMN reductase [Synechococcus sp. PCC 7335]|uniref:NADPH-dependent FMN reductase n=1 Tax=Synechococcus sp. (strain ATCC 29403 / PCC 7335) TaxID=91464 RepID=UPI0021014EE3
MKVVCIGGSLREDSYSMQALELAAERLRLLGAEVTVLDLKEMTLPFCDGGSDYPEYPDVEVMRSHVTESDALVIATPEYHGSVSGVIKNALDLMSFDHLDGKVTGMISVLGGQSNSNALNDLRVIMRWVHAWVIPEQVAIGQAWNAFDSEGNFKDEKLSQRLDAFVKSLFQNTERLRG